MVVLLGSLKYLMIKTIIKTFDEFQYWMVDNLKMVMALDFETTSLNYVEMEPVGFSLSNGRAACYVPYNKEIYRFMGILMTDKDDDAIMWVMHNASFDLKCIKKFMLGVSPKKIFCTLIGSQLLNENLFSHGLKYLAEHWLKIPVDQIKKWEEVSAGVQESTQTSMSYVNTSEFIDYAINDAIWCYQLYEIISKALKKQQLEHLFYSVEMPFQYVLRDLEINGIAIDKDEYESAKIELPKLLEESLIEMCKAAEVEYWYDTDLFGNKILSTNINFNSSPQIIELIENLGFEVTERTKPSKTHPKGQKSFNAKVKASFKGKHPFFDHLAKYDELEGLLSSFILPLEDYIDSDGRVRTSYGMKRTGRLSSSKPNLQNQPNPKKKKLIYNYRKIFVPGD